MIDKIKVILDISDTDSDEKLKIYCDFAIEYVKSYCGLSEIPKNLENIVCMITVSLYQNTDSVSSLSLGDVSMNFSNQNKLLEYRNILNKYRKVGF